MNLSVWEKNAVKLITRLVGKFSDNFSHVAVDVYPDSSGNYYYVKVTFLFKESFKGEDSDYYHSFKRQINQILRAFLPPLDKEYSLSSGSSTISHYETYDVPYLKKVKPKLDEEKSLLYLKKLNAELLSEASKKKILIDKVGLNEKNAESLDRACGPLSVWMANKLIKYQLDAIKSWRPEDTPTEEEVLNKLNSNFSVLLPKVTEIMDWVRVGLNGNLGENKDLTIQGLLKKSKEWHDSLGVGQGQINYVEPHTHNIIADFRNKSGEGFYWVDLQTNNSNEECERMGHCGRTGHGNILYSLREVKKLPGDKYTINKSHLTASIGSDGTLYQLKGPKNSKPKSEYHEYILSLFYIEDEDGEHLINSFGSEYASERDFKITDLPNDVIINLYENRPELFESRGLQRKLSELGIIELPPIDYNVKIFASPSNLGRYVDGDYIYRRWKTKEGLNKSVSLFEIILAGDTWDLWQNYDDKDWINALEYYVNDKNEKEIERLIRFIAEKSEEFIEEDFNSMSLEDKINEYDDDWKIRQAINSTTSDAEANDYSDMLHTTLKDAVGELGTVTEFNDSGVEFIVDMKPHLDKLGISEYDEILETCDDNLSCVFEELIDSEIDKPSFDVDDRWYPDIDEGYFNEMLSDRLSEVEY